VGKGVLTAPFARVDGAFQCEGVPAAAIAAAVGTPAYVYSAGAMRTQYQRLAAVLDGVPHRVHYAMKANGSLGVLGVMRALGVGVDCVSGGELFRAHLAGFAPRDIVLGGVGKREDEIRDALELHIHCLTAESEAEVRLIADVARSLDVVAPVALRVNPEVTVDAFHEYVKTGQSGDKFGIPIDQAFEVAKLTASLDDLRLVGLHQHVGSQLFNLDGLVDGAERLLALYAELRAKAPKAVAAMRTFDVGGGLGASYNGEPEPDLAVLGRLVRRAHDATGLIVLLEPGRFLVANAGVLLTRVLYRKRSGAREFVVTDAGMNDLLRPALYDAWHRVDAARATDRRIVAEIVGPVCESGDFLAHAREVDDVHPGDLLVVQSAGAYGFVMSSNYNARPRAAEVLVDAGKWGVVRDREQYEDLVRGERAIPEWSEIP